MSKSSGDATTTQISAPWSAQQPFLQDIFSQAQDLYQNKQPQYTPFSQVTPYSQTTNVGINQLARRGRNGSPLNQSAQGLAMATLGGDFLPGGQGQNPWLDEAYNRALEQSMPMVNSLFGGAGRTGAEAHRSLVGETLGDLSYNIYGRNYDAERNRQMEAMRYAPQLAATDYQDIAAVQQAGAMKDQKRAEHTQDRVNRFNFGQNQPWRSLGDYASIVNGTYGSQGQTDQELFNNPVGGALGGGLIGSQIATAAGIGGPWGALGGGLLGLLGEIL